jgi:molybdopterin-guanine dinucleotide biosynthesis protein
VILVVGVNGSGKTTSIGKLAQHFAGQGLKVALAAGDTFRAAAAEQLAVGRRTGAAPAQAGDPRWCLMRCGRRVRAASTSCSPTPPPAAEPEAPDGRAAQGQ